MQMENVALFVSNDLKNPNNTASDFKVTYNVPIDLTGKQMALTSVAVTKSQPNVLDETVTITPPKRSEYSKGTKQEMVISQFSMADLGLDRSGAEIPLPPSPLPPAAKKSKKTVGETSPPRTGSSSSSSRGANSGSSRGRGGRGRGSGSGSASGLWVIPPPKKTEITKEKFVERFKKELQHSSKVLVQSRYAYNPKTQHLRVYIKNQSVFEAGVTLMRDSVELDDEETPLADMWEVLGIENGKLTSTTPVLNGQFQSFALAPGKAMNLLISLKHVSDRNLKEFEFYKKFANNCYLAVSAYPANEKKFAVPALNIKPGPGHFTNVEELLRRLNENPNFKKYVKLGMDKAGRVTLWMKKKGKVHLGGLQHHLGFDSVQFESGINNQVFTANRLPDMTRGTHHFFIYCNLVKGTMVNDKFPNLLATVDAVKGDYGLQVKHDIPHPIFVDCVEGPMQTAEFTIADDVGNHTNLLMSRTMLTCAIRPKGPPN